METLDNGVFDYIPGNGKSSTRMSILNEVYSNKFLYNNLFKKVTKEYGNSEDLENNKQLTKKNDNIWKKINSLDKIAIY